MRIIVLSDSHGMKYQLDRMIPIIEGADMFIHAGDHFRDSVYLAQKTGIDTISVRGNCDFDNVESELFFELDGVKIFLTHGHRYSVKYDLDSLAIKGKEVGADLVIFGHTHTPTDVEVQGIRIINPGSISLPRGTNMRTYVELEVENGKIYVHFNELA